MLNWQNVLVPNDLHGNGKKHSTEQGSLTEGKGLVQLTSLNQFFFMVKIYLFTKQPTLMRRSTVLSPFSKTCLHRMTYMEMERNLALNREALLTGKA